LDELALVATMLPDGNFQKSVLATSTLTLNKTMRASRGE